MNILKQQTIVINLLLLIVMVNKLCQFQIKKFMEVQIHLSDGYFIYNTYTDDNKKSAVLVKDGKLVLTLDSYSDGVYYILASKCAYKDGILYAGSTKGFTVAYDIKNKKELWQVDSTFIEGYSLDDDFIRVQTSVNPSGDNSSFLRDHVQTQLLITMAIK